MKIGRIIHQQIVQLRWHFLACLGLLMALPIEEGIINLRDGAGFYASGLSLGIPLTVAPLLAGLIACANVQADLDDRRYIFWQSKPVGVKTFMAIKYLVGLLVAFVAIALPIAFMFISCGIVQNEKIERGFIAYVINFQFISLLAYSLCFFCNVLVRKTARAWLIGMSMVVFLLLVPFILPLNFKDVENDFLRVASLVYLSVTLIPALVAFIASLIAASRNWHLQTNLKGLLWTGASLIFLLMLLFTRQVANIKVLDEVEIDAPAYAYIGSLNRVEDSVQLASTFEVDTNNQRIQLTKPFSPPSKELREQIKNSPPLYKKEKDHYRETWPRYCTVSYRTGEEIYTFKLNTYYIREKVGKSSWTPKHKKAYLCCYRLAEGIHRIPVSVLDLSECVDENRPFKAGLRQVDDKLVVFIQDSFAVVKIKDNGSLELIENNINALKGYSENIRHQDKIFKLPLIQTQDISVEERVNLTISLNYNYRHYSWRRNDLFSESSILDVSDGGISFCLLDEDEIARFDVVKWDEDYIYCRFRDARSFTFLEQIFGQISENDSWFVQDGKLYAYEDMKLLVFDIRSEHIRKLGHFQRLRENFSIQEVEVLDNGDILVCSVLFIKGQVYDKERGCWIDNDRAYLQLLKNPE